MYFVYRVANKFSDTLDELFVVNCLISKFFFGNTRWKLVSSSHNLKILIKSTKHGLSYSLKCDPRPISKFTFVSHFDTEPWEFFSLKKCYFLFKWSLSWQNKKIINPTALIQAKIFRIYITNSIFLNFSFKALYQKGSQTYF